SGWIILGAISLLVRGTFSWGWVVPRLAGLAVYLAVVFFVLRKPLRRIVADHVARHGGMRLDFAPYIVILLFVSAAITSNLGVFAIIRRFVIRVALPDDREFYTVRWVRAAPIAS